MLYFKCYRKYLHFEFTYKCVLKIHRKLNKKFTWSTVVLETISLHTAVSSMASIFCSAYPHFRRSNRMWMMVATSLFIMKAGSFCEIVDCFRREKPFLSMNFSNHPRLATKVSCSTGSSFLSSNSALALNMIILRLTWRRLFLRSWIHTIIVSSMSVSVSLRPPPCNLFRFPGTVLNWSSFRFQSRIDCLSMKALY